MGEQCSKPPIIREKRPLPSFFFFFFFFLLTDQNPLRHSQSLATCNITFLNWANPLSLVETRVHQNEETKQANARWHLGSRQPAMMPRGLSHHQQFRLHVGYPRFYIAEIAITTCSKQQKISWMLKSPKEGASSYHGLNKQSIHILFNRMKKKS